jgi:transcription termination factor NusB
MRPNYQTIQNKETDYFSQLLKEIEEKKDKKDLNSDTYINFSLSQLPPLITEQTIPQINTISYKK